MREFLGIFATMLCGFVIGAFTGDRENLHQKAVDKALAECEASLVNTNAPRNIKCTVEIRAITKAE